MIDLTGIQGSFPFREYYLEIVDRLPDNACVFEIGVWEGRSTLSLADMIRKSGKRVEFHCCDTFCGGWNKKLFQYDYYTLFMRNLERFDLGDYVIVNKGISWEVLVNFPDNYFDFIFIDGNHYCEPVYDDVSISLRKLKRRGILAGHDLSYETVRCGLGKAGISWRGIAGDVWEADLRKLM